MIGKLIGRVTKIALIVVAVAIATTVISWFVYIPEALQEGVVLGAMCVSAYLIGLLHANSVLGRDNVKKEVKCRR